MTVSEALSTISLVTPNYNNGPYLPQTIRSVLSQGYPNLEYFVIDGGSTDNSVDIIRRHESKLAGWLSERDSGQSDAINKGFAQSSGEIMGWLNSDDVLWPGALEAVARFFATRPSVDIVMGWNLQFRDQRVFYLHDPLPLKLEYLLFTGYDPPQDSILWRRRVYESLGPLDIHEHFVMDREYFIRMTLGGFRAGVLRRPIGGFRVHPEQKARNPKLVKAKQAIRLRYWERMGISQARGRRLEALWGRRMLVARAVKRVQRLTLDRGRVGKAFAEANTYLAWLASDCTWELKS